MVDLIIIFFVVFVLFCLSVGIFSVADYFLKLIIKKDTSENINENHEGNKKDIKWERLNLGRGIKKTSKMQK